MKGLRIAVLFMVAIMMAVAFVGCGSEPTAPTDDPSETATGGELIVAMAGTADVLDPHVSGARRSHSIARHIYDTLVSRSFEDQSYGPGLATEWEWNSDHSSITMTLREDVLFHDGTAFNAEAVKFSLDRIVDPATMSKAAADYIGPYDSTEVLDEYTVRVNYRTTVSPSVVFDAMSKVHLAPVSPTAAQSMSVEEFGRNPVGTGPFVFKEWTAANRITLERNPDYNWAPPIYEHQGPAHLERIVFLEIPEATTRVAALEGGEIDVTLEVAEESVASVKENPQFGYLSAENPGSPIIMWMNTEDEILSDIRVRKAILYGFDQQEVVDSVFLGLYPIAKGPLAPSTWGYNSAVEDMYPYDQEKAIDLLEEAGWQLGSSGIREKDGRQLTIEILDLGDARRIEFFQAKMSEIGISVDARVVTSDYLWEVTRTAEDYQMGSTWFGYTDAHVLHLLYHSSNVGTGFAISRWEDPVLDTMLEEAATMTDTDMRLQTYYDAQVYIMEKALMVPFMGRNEHAGFQNYVQNFRLEFEHPILYEVYLDPAK